MLGVFNLSFMIVNGTFVRLYVYDIEKFWNQVGKGSIEDLVNYGYLKFIV